MSLTLPELFLSYYHFQEVRPAANTQQVATPTRIAVLLGRLLLRPYTPVTTYPDPVWSKLLGFPIERRAVCITVADYRAGSAGATAFALSELRGGGGAGGATRSGNKFAGRQPQFQSRAADEHNAVCPTKVPAARDPAELQPGQAADAATSAAAAAGEAAPND